MPETEYGAAFDIITGINATTTGDIRIEGRSELGKTSVDIPGNFAPAIIGQLISLLPHFRKTSLHPLDLLMPIAAMTAASSQTPGQCRLMVTTAGGLTLNFLFPLDRLDEAAAGLRDFAGQESERQKRNPPRSH